MSISSGSIYWGNVPIIIHMDNAALTYLMKMLEPISTTSRFSIHQEGSTVIAMHYQGNHVSATVNPVAISANNKPWGSLTDLLWAPGVAMTPTC